MNLQDNDALRNKILQFYAYQMMMKNLHQNFTNNKNEGQIPINSNFTQNLRNYPNQFFNLPLENLMLNLSNQSTPLNQFHELYCKNVSNDLMGVSSIKSLKSNHQNKSEIEGKKGFSLFNKNSEIIKNDSGNTSFKECKSSILKDKNKLSKFQLKRNKKIKNIYNLEKKHECKIDKCRRTFYTEYKLKIHKRAHYGIRPFKCDIPSCCHSFSNKDARFIHKKNSHFELKNDLKFSCCHQGCTLRFKTKKQKLSHHNKLELECKEEKNILIKLVSKFNKAFFSIAKGFNINLTELEKLNEIKDLKESYEKTTMKLQDPDFFFFCVGDKLHFPSLNKN